MILNLSNIYNLLYSPCNMISLNYFNNHDMYQNNKNQILYYIKTRKTLVYIE